MQRISYARHRFPPEIIQHVVWLYFRFPLNYRDVEDLLAERDIDVSYETARRWTLKFGLAYARKLRRLRPRTDGRWLCLPLIPSDLVTVHPAIADRTRTNALHQLTIVKNPRISAADRVFGTHNRPPGLPRYKQSWLATVLRKG